MEVTHYESGVMQRDVQHRLREERSAEAAGNKQRNKADGEQHGCGEAHAPVLNGSQPVEGLNGGGYADGHGHDGEGKSRVRAHAAHEHVMAPDHKSQQSDGEHGVDHGLVTKDRFAGKS